MLRAFSLVTCIPAIVSLINIGLPPMTIMQFTMKCVIYLFYAHSIRIPADLIHVQEDLVPCRQTWFIQ